MPSVDSNSSYSSSDSSLSSPRVLLTDIRQQQQQQHQQVAIQEQQLTQYHHRHHQMRTPTNMNTSHVCVTRYKTELCRPFTETGKCKYGDKCQFSHGMKELRILMRHPKYKTEYCRTFHTTGYCPYGPRCHFIHDIHEARATTTTDTDDISMRRHSDLRMNQSIQKSTARNRINSDYTTLSSSHLINHSTSSKLPFTFDELNHALLSCETDDLFQQTSPQQQQEDYYPSILSTMTNSLTHRTFSSSSSTNSS